MKILPTSPPRAEEDVLPCLVSMLLPELADTEALEIFRSTAFLNRGVKDADSPDTPK